MPRSGNMCRYFTDLKIKINKTLGIFDDLTAGHHGTGDFRTGYPGGFQKFINRFADRTHIASAAGIASAAACYMTGFHRTCPGINGMKYIAVFIK